MDTSKLTKILSAEQIRRADQFTIENQPIASIDLMEKASKAFVSWFLKKFGIAKHAKVFAGTGNNGGDGLAISRLLIEHGCSVHTYFIGNVDKSSPDFKINYYRLIEIERPVALIKQIDLPELHSEDIIIDGLFGSGLSREVGGLYAELINHVNDSTVREVIAIDIASGLFCDQNTPGGAVLKCSRTVSFQVPKLGFYLPQNYDYVGELSVVDIGLEQEFLSKVTSNSFLVTEEFVKTIYKKRLKYAHKGSMGRNLIVSGSKGKMGAAVLATKACLRSGAGLVTTFIPNCGYNILQTAVPEAMTITDESEDLITNVPSTEGYDILGIGPGLGQADETAFVLKSLLEESKSPMILDADALNIISTYGLIDIIPQGSILTPHPGEFRRLVGDWGNDFERLELQRAFSQEHQVIIILKGAHSSITDQQGNVYFNTTGNPGMATGGSGDVLTGIATSLVGQGYISIEAAILGAHIHGLAGNLFANRYSEEGLIAGDLIEYLPEAFKTLS
ncbi:MAG: NAD(P)H-hydrate dehydratase [Cyclobacteriaceae bacterium]